MFTLSLCDRTMRTLAVIETYESLIWTERYNKEGEFELVTTDVGSWLNIIQNEFLYGSGEGATGTIPYLYWLKKSDTEVVMTIESFKMSSDIEEGNKLTITGRSLEALLDRTVIYDNHIDYTASPYILIKNIINKYIISRENPNATPRTEFIESSDERITDPPPNWWYEINFDLEGMTVLEAINKICDYSGFGYNILPREHAGYWEYTQDGRKYWKSDIVYEFRVYLGIDHRDDVIFSPRFDNFANSEFEVSSTEVYTGYYVKLPNLKILTNDDPDKSGEKAHLVDSDVAQILYEASDHGMQSFGRTGFIDLSDLNMSDCLEWYKANYGEEWVKNSYPTYTPREQQSMLQSYSNAEIENMIKEGITVNFDIFGWLHTYAVRLARHTIDDNNRIRSAFSGSAEMAASNYILGVDYSLGDIIRVENEFGISGSSQVVELVQSFNTQDGYTLLPTFTSFTPELDRWLHRND